MASTSTNQDLLRSCSVSLTPLEYFTDASKSVSNKTDLILIVGQDKFYCHRLLLSLISPVFSRMFDGEFKEHDQKEIVLHGKTSQSILELLKNIYPQFDGEINNENVEDFLQLADEYMIEHVKQPCEEFLEKQLVDFKFVELPVQHKTEKVRISSRISEENQVVRRRNVPSRPSSSTTKPNDKNSNSSPNPTRLVTLLDRTKIPKFFNGENQQIQFDEAQLEVCLRRLKILYRIERGKFYSRIVDSILSVLQFFPSNIFFPFFQISSNEHFSTDEILLNDLQRARMLFLEDFTADGETHRPVVLSDAFRKNFLQISSEQQKPTDDAETHSITLTTSSLSLPSDDIPLTASFLPASSANDEE